VDRGQAEVQPAVSFKFPNEDTDPDKIGPTDDHSKLRVAQRSGQWLDHPQDLDQT
jgi:hypothetical protein